MVKIPNSIKNNYKKIINEVVFDLSHDVVVYSPPSLVDCPNCIYDSVNKKSTGVFDTSFVAPVTLFTGTSSQRTVTPTSFSRGRCPICFNEGTLKALVKTTIQGIFSFYPDTNGGTDGLIPEPYGIDGKIHAQLKTNCQHYELLLNADYVEYSGVKYGFTYKPLLSGIGIDAIVNCWLTQLDTDSRIKNA